MTSYKRNNIQFLHIINLFVSETMEVEWYVSDSEGEDDREHYKQLMISNLKGLCTVANQDIHRSHNTSNYIRSNDHIYVPKNLNALYTQIENDGFIALQCKGSKRSVETMENEIHTVSNHTNHSAACYTTSETSVEESLHEDPSTVK